MKASVLAQLVCLAAGLVSTLITSIARTLLLFLGTRSISKLGFELYEGRVWHERRHPAVHRFDYNVKYALIHLDSAPGWFQKKHHLTADEARRIAGTSGSVHLLTVPTSVGYEQNPLSIYYCYDKTPDQKKELVKCIAEVTNTPWAERVTFLFQPGEDIVAKPLHVSPFMDMLGAWRIKASHPTDSLHVVITVQHPEYGNFFSAKLCLTRTDSSDPEKFFWLMPHKVAFWIYWQAVLLVMKGVSFISHPKYEQGAAYRDTARKQDMHIGSKHEKERYFSWREPICWPWK